MLQKLRFILLLTLLLCSSFAIVTAAVGEPNGAATTPGVSSRTADPTTTEVNISANNITFVDVSSSYVSEKWSGFYGNISGSFILADSTGNNFYQWTVADMTGAVVYASNNTINWGTGSFFPLVASFASPWLIGSATDNFTNTFSNTENFESPDFFSGSGIVNDTPYVATFNSTGSGTLKTYALMNNATNQSVFASKVVDDANGFTNQTVDYQMLVPAYSVVSYYFYLELP